MKHAKVAIQRKASEESSQYRDWRQARMREISQLRREARVSKLEHHRLLSAHAKQEAILKRRTEEVAAVQRRLREQAKSGRGTARGGRTDAARSKSAGCTDTHAASSARKSAAASGSDRSALSYHTTPYTSSPAKMSCTPLMLIW